MAKFIASEVEKLSSDDKSPEGINFFLAKSKQTISLADLKWVKERLSLHDRFLCQYLKGTDLVLPSPPVQPRNPELEARCQRLRKEQENREYRAMTKMVDPKRFREPEESIAFQMKQINRQLIGVAQFIFSVAAGFVFGFLGLELMFGNLDMKFRLLSGIGCGLVIAVAEIYFLIMHLSADDQIPNTSGADAISTQTVTSDSKKLHQD